VFSLHPKKECPSFIHSYLEDTHTHTQNAWLIRF